jgi:phospholipase/carboxylesterase
MMNRLSQSTLTTTLDNVTSPVFNAGGATFTRQASFGGQSLFAPLHYEPGYAYPLIVWLHGEGGTENHLRRLMPMVSVRNYVAVAPRGTARPGNSTDAKQGFTWLQTGEHIHAAEQRVFDAVAAAK